MRYLCLLRGVNVGGKNKVSMTELKERLSAAGFSDVLSCINSGNILLTSRDTEDAVARQVEQVIVNSFKLDSALIRVVALTLEDLQQIVEKAPKNFGTKPETYHSDILFPMEGADSADIIAATITNPTVDTAWEKNGVVYFQRVSTERTRSRLGRIIESPVYKNLTIRSWKTTVKLRDLLRA